MKNGDDQIVFNIFSTFKQKIAKFPSSRKQINYDFKNPCINYLSFQNKYILAPKIPKSM
jgi:hypothetical protein